jgi:hypothetical protein
MGLLADPGHRLTALWLLVGLSGGWWDSLTGSEYFSKTLGWMALLVGGLFVSLCWWSAPR